MTLDKIKVSPEQWHLASPEIKIFVEELDTLMEEILASKDIERDYAAALQNNPTLKFHDFLIWYVNGFDTGGKINTLIERTKQEISQESSEDIGNLFDLVQFSLNPSAQEVINKVNNRETITPQEASLVAANSLSQENPEQTAAFFNEIARRGNEIKTFYGTDTVKESAKATRERQAIRRILKSRNEEFDMVIPGEKFRWQRAELRKLKRAFVGWFFTKGVGADNVDEVFLAMKNAYDDPTKDVTDNKMREDLGMETKYKNDRKEGRRLAKIGEFYKKFRQGDYDGQYIGRVFQLFEDQLTGDKTVATLYNENLSGKVTWLSDRRKDKEKNLQTLVDMKGTYDSATHKFIGLLADYDFNGKIDYADRGMRGGLAFEKAYQKARLNIIAREGKWAEADIAETDKKIIINLMSVLDNVIGNLPSSDDGELLLRKIKETKQNWNIDLFMQYIKTNITQMKMIQDAMKNSSLDPQRILEYGENAVSEYTQARKEALEHDETGLNEEEKEAIRFSVDEKLAEITTDARNNGFALGEVEREHLRTHMSAAVQNIVIQEKLHGGVGVGVTVPLFLKGLNFNVAAGVSGPDIAPIAGVSLSYDRKLWAWFATNTAVGVTSIAFIPFASQSFSKEWVRDPKKGTLNNKARSVKTIDLGVHGRVMLIGPLPISTVGIHAGRQRDKIAGINLNYNRIATEFKNLSEQLVTIQGNTYEERLAAVKAILATMGNSSGQETTDQDGNTSKKEKPTWKTSEASMTQAAQNILTGLSYLWKLDTPEAQAEAAARLTEYYANAWRNKSVEQVKWWLKGVDVGIDWVIGTMVFIPSLAVTFDKFWSTYYKDSEASREEVEQADLTGAGNILLNARKFKEQKSLDRTAPKIEQYELDYLNASLVNVFSWADQEQMQFDGDFIKIPASLYQKHNINIKLDQSMKDLVYYDDSEEKPYLYIPRGVPFRLLQNHGGSTTQTVLNIGSSNSKDAFNLLGAKTKEALQGAWFATQYNNLASFKENAKNIVDAQRITKDSLQTALRDITSQAQSQNMDIAQKLSQLEIKTYNSVTKVVRLSDDTVFKLDNDVEISMIGNDLIFKALNSQQWDLPSFIVKGKKTETVNPNDNLPSAFSFEYNESFNEDLSDLWSLERRNPGAYKTLMASLVIRGDGDTVNVDAAYDALKTLVASANATTSYRKNLPTIHGYIDQINGQANRETQESMKAFLVHKMAVVMAYSPNYEGKKISRLLGGRNSLYNNLISTTSLKGFDHSWFDKNVYNNIDTTETYNLKTNRQSHKNIVGMAAFYRNDKAWSTEATGFALAPLGDVSVYGKSWAEMLAVFDKQATEYNTIIAGVSDNVMKSNSYKTAIKTNISAYIKKLTEQETPPELSDNDLIQLLMWNTVNINNYGDVKIDVNAVAYGQAECWGNAGFGIQLNALTVSGQKGIIDQQGDLVASAAQSGMVWGGKLYINDLAAIGQAQRKASSFTLGFAFKTDLGKKQKTDEPTDWEIDTNPGGDDDWDGWDGTVDTNPGGDGDWDTGPNDTDSGGIDTWNWWNDTGDGTGGQTWGW